jgi:hypothetical protein
MPMHASIRRLNLLSSTVVLGVLSACVGQDGPRGDPLAAAEVVAARSILTKYPVARVTIDSAYTIAGAAPGGPTGRFRPSARTGALATALRAAVGSHVPDAGVRLRLSEPQVVGDSVRFTVTLDWGPNASEMPGRSGYHTQRLTLIPEHGAWRVVRVEELGIT